MTRVIAVVTISALLVGCADTDEVFMDVVHDAGISISQRDAVTLATEVCAAFDEGTTCRPSPWPG